MDCDAVGVPTEERALTGADERALSRAATIADRLGLAGQPIRQGQGWSNDVWLYDDGVIRMAARAGQSPLALEVAIAPRLPAAIGYPGLLGSGVLDGHRWMAQQRIRGDNLAGVWPSLRSDQRAHAVADLWDRLSAVPQTDLTGVILPPTPLYAFDPEERPTARGSPSARRERDRRAGR